MKAAELRNLTDAELTVKFEDTKKKIIWIEISTWIRPVNKHCSDCASKKRYC